MTRGIKPPKTMVVKTMTESDSDHDPVKFTIEVRGKRSPEMRHVPKYQQGSVHHVAKSKDLYEKEVPGLLE